MSDPQSTIAVLLSCFALVVLLTAPLAAGGGEAVAAGGDVILHDLEAVEFVHYGQERGHILSHPRSIPELEIVSGPAGDGYPAVAVFEARPNDVDPGTGIHVSSGLDGSGSLSLYTNGTTRVFVTDQGLMLRGDHRLFFGDEQHYLFRCGDDLCWHGHGGERNLTLAGEGEPAAIPAPARPAETEGRAGAGAAGPP